MFFTPSARNHTKHDASDKKKSKSNFWIHVFNVSTPQKNTAQHNVCTLFRNKKHRGNTCVLNAFSKYAKKAWCFSRRVVKKWCKWACFYVFACSARENTRRFDMFWHTEALKACKTLRFRKAYFRNHIKTHDIVEITAWIVKNIRVFNSAGPRTT